MRAISRHAAIPRAARGAFHSLSHRAGNSSALIWGDRTGSCSCGKACLASEIRPRITSQGAPAAGFPPPALADRAWRERNARICGPLTPSERCGDKVKRGLFLLAAGRSGVIRRSRFCKFRLPSRRRFPLFRLAKTTRSKVTPADRNAGRAVRPHTHPDRVPYR